MSQDQVISLVLFNCPAPYLEAKQLFLADGKIRLYYIGPSGGTRTETWDLDPTAVVQANTLGRNRNSRDVPVPGHGSGHVVEAGQVQLRHHVLAVKGYRK
jgi:hypothetical protein